MCRNGHDQSTSGSRWEAALETLPVAGAAPEPTFDPPDVEIIGEFPAAEAAGEWAVVVDCDLRVRERLRFLAWMHRVHRETSQGLESSTADDPTVQPASSRIEELSHV